MEDQTEKIAAEPRKKIKKKSKNKVSYVIALLFVALIVGSYIYSKEKAKQPTPDSVKDKVLTYVKDNLVQPGSDVSVKSITKENSLYKIVLSVGKQEVTAYSTLDGSKFFPQSFDTNAPKQAASAQDSKPQSSEASTKQDVPDVELFVMSYCPYGTQIEKGILPVLDKLGSKINFKLNFVDYTLHGKKEFDENLTQYCIQKQAPAKLNAYLKCFDQSSDSASCLTSAGITKSQIDSCVTTTDQNNQLTVKYNEAGSSSNPPFVLTTADNEKFGVKGSPTLVVNGAVLNSSRDPQSLLKTICSGFNTAPSECSATLSTDTPAPGFASGTAANSAPASCATP